MHLNWKGSRVFKIAWRHFWWAIINPSDYEKGLSINHDSMYLGFGRGQIISWQYRALVNKIVPVVGSQKLHRETSFNHFPLQEHNYFYRGTFGHLQLRLPDWGLEPQELHIVRLHQQLRPANAHCHLLLLTGHLG